MNSLPPGSFVTVILLARKGARHAEWVSFRLDGDRNWRFAAFTAPTPTAPPSREQSIDFCSGTYGRVRTGSTERGIACAFLKTVNVRSHDGVRERLLPLPAPPRTRVCAAASQRRFARPSLISCSESGMMSVRLSVLAGPVASASGMYNRRDKTGAAAWGRASNSELPSCTPSTREGAGRPIPWPPR